MVILLRRKKHVDKAFGLKIADQAPVFMRADRSACEVGIN